MMAMIKPSLFRVLSLLRGSPHPMGLGWRSARCRERKERGDVYLKPFVIQIVLFTRRGRSGNNTYINGARTQMNAVILLGGDGVEAL